MNRNIKPAVLTVLTALLAGFLALTVACGRPERGEEIETVVVARVDGRSITAADVSRRMYPQGRPKDALPDETALEAVLDQLIDRALILNWAQKNKIGADDETVDARVATIKADYETGGFDTYLKSQGMNLEQFKEKVKEDITVELAVEKAVTSRVNVSEADIVKYYEANKEKYSPGKEYHVQQIIVENQTEAEGVLTKLAFGAAFEEVAAESSLAADKYAGGDVGYVPAGAFPPEVAEQLTVLPVGKVSPAIQTGYGFFIVKLLDVREAGTVPLDEIRAEIETEIRTKAQEKLYAEWIKSLREGADIDIDKKELERI